MITYMINDLVYNHNMHKINNIPLPSFHICTLPQLLLPPPMASAPSWWLWAMFKSLRLLPSTNYKYFASSNSFIKHHLKQTTKIAYWKTIILMPSINGNSSCASSSTHLCECQGTNSKVFPWSQLNTSTDGSPLLPQPLNQLELHSCNRVKLHL